MLELQAPGPLSAPDRISPSQAEIARKCPLRFVLDKSIREEELPMPSGSGARYAGSVFHGVIEAARRGRVGDPPELSRLEAIWRRLLKEAEEDARRNGDESWLPLEESVRSLERTRLWCMRLAMQQRARRRSGEGASQTEAWLEADDGLIAGKPDAIDDEGGSLILRDFKTGEVIDPSGVVKREYAVQMLLYAALFRESRGQWPDELHVVDKSGRSHRVEIIQREASDELASAKSLLLGLQGKLEAPAGIEDDALVDLAEPEGGVCGTCRGRPFCSRYLQKLSENGEIVHGEHRYAPSDFLGELLEVSVTEKGRVRLEVRHNGEVKSIRNLTRHGGFRDIKEPDESPPLPTPGGRIVIFNAIPCSPREVASSPSHYVVGRGSRAFKVPN